MATELFLCDVCNHRLPAIELDESYDLDGICRIVCKGCQSRNKIRVCDCCDTWRRDDQFSDPGDWCDECVLASEDHYQGEYR